MPSALEGDLSIEKWIRCCATRAGNVQSGGRNLDRRDVCWVVLSLDENEELWRETLSARRTLDETIGWVGNSPQIMERLGLSVIPQVLVLDQDGRVAVDNTPLPSQGLGAHLLELLPKK